MYVQHLPARSARQQVVRITPEVTNLVSLLSTLIIALAVLIYIYYYGKTSKKSKAKLKKAVEFGLNEEPTTLHPKIDPSLCIGSTACVKACPQHDVLGLISGRGALINATHCVGHGACAAACPVGAVTLVFGNEKRGVDIPYVTPDFETNVKGIFIAGELGGMGLVRNAVTQGKQAVEYITCFLKDKKKDSSVYDVLIVGAGPAGIGASLAAMKAGLKFVTIEQGDIGGTILHYPRQKIVMTQPMDLPLHGKIKFRETTKEALLELFLGIIETSGLKINSNEKMTALTELSGEFKVTTSKGEYLTRTVILAIGRRGTPRKLGVPGEELSKVSYSLLDPEQHKGNDIIVVGGGDSAVEAAMALASCGNKVALSYRGDALSRIKPGNRDRLETSLAAKKLTLLLNSNLKEIMTKEVQMEVDGKLTTMPNDFVYIFAGGELPNDFLRGIGVKVEKKFGTA
jgi:thioredoxin reductase (NADPH)